MTSGLPNSTPSHPNIRSAIFEESSMFFGLWGSMAGGMTSTRGTGNSGGAKFPKVKTAAS